MSAPQQLVDAKTVATLQARAALAGAELVQLGDGSFVGFHAAWGMHRHMADATAVEVWLKRLGS